MSRAPAFGLLAALVVAACGASSADEDPYAPACGGTSPASLVSEQTPGGQCPSHPSTLTGSQGDGDTCSDSTDCAPECCTCPGTGQTALVAECNGGNCLLDATACCLWQQQCGQ